LSARLIGSLLFDLKDSFRRRPHNVRIACPYMRRLACRCLCERIAMTTVFVLMQPFSGMVLVKSFYRSLGTAVGAVAGGVPGALFVQQPDLHMLGMIAWVSACIAAAVRYRHARWYGFVLAGYTAALIGVQNVATPDGLFLAALTRAAEVGVGIICSRAVSALIGPQRSGLALLQALQVRYGDFTAFAVDVLSPHNDVRKDTGTCTIPIALASFSVSAVMRTGSDGHAVRFD
jgi:uncharacterized membrane protein YccC